MRSYFLLNFFFLFCWNENEENQTLTTSISNTTTTTTSQINQSFESHFLLFYHHPPWFYLTEKYCHGILWDTKKKILIFFLKIIKKKEKLWKILFFWFGFFFFLLYSIFPLESLTNRLIDDKFYFYAFLFFFSFFSQDRLNENPYIAEGPTITLERVERQNSGIYQCIAENGVREPVSANIQLTVLCEFNFLVFLFIYIWILYCTYVYR